MEKDDKTKIDFNNLDKLIKDIDSKIDFLKEKELEDKSIEEQNKIKEKWLKDDKLNLLENEFKYFKKNIDIINSQYKNLVNDFNKFVSEHQNTLNRINAEFQNNKGINPISQVKNYDQSNDYNKTDDEMLTFFYEDIYNIQQELITTLSLFDKNQILLNLVFYIISIQ